MRHTILLIVLLLSACHTRDLNGASNLRGRPRKPALASAGKVCDANLTPRAEQTEQPEQATLRATEPKDWPTYNYNFSGSRHNVGESHLARENAAGLVEKWRFPPHAERESVGAIQRR